MENCSVCGEKIGAFNGKWVQYGDATICDKCADPIKGRMSNLWKVDTKEEFINETNMIMDYSQANYSSQVVDEIKTTISERYNRRYGTETAETTKDESSTATYSETKVSTSPSQLTPTNTTSIGGSIKVIAIIVLIFSIIGSFVFMKENVAIGIAVLIVSVLTGLICIGIGEICININDIRNKLYKDESKDK